MDVCMYGWMDVCMYVCMYGCMYVWMYVCVYVGVYVCMYACRYVCVYIYIYIYTQGDSGGICTTLGNDRMSDFKQKSSCEHGSDFERLRSYGHFLFPVHALM
jgi:hypothetical protein